MVVLAFTVRIRLRAEIYQPLRFGSTALATGRVERRLAAILAADVTGHSRLIGADEEGPHERLKTIVIKLVDPKVAGHKGCIVKTSRRRD